MIRGNDLDLARHPAARRARKRPVPVPVTFARQPGTIETREGAVAFEAGDAICTGVEGERWPITRARFEASYEPLDGQPMGEDGRYVKKPVTVRALRMNEPFEVEVNWGDGLLRGKPGDWLVQYGPGDYGVVSREVFEQTYDLLDD